MYPFWILSNSNQVHKSLSFWDFSTFSPSLFFNSFSKKPPGRTVLKNRNLKILKWKICGNSVRGTEKCAKAHHQNENERPEWGTSFPFLSQKEDDDDDERTIYKFYFKIRQFSKNFPNFYCKWDSDSWKRMCVFCARRISRKWYFKM